MKIILLGPPEQEKVLKLNQYANVMIFHTSHRKHAERGCRGTY